MSSAQRSGLPYNLPEYLLRFTLMLALLCGVYASEPIVQAQTSIPSSFYNPYGFDAVRTINEIAHPHSDLVLVSSHRGLHALVNGEYPDIPENSLQAIGFAASQGLEEIELDIKLTSEGVLVMSHDQSWGRTRESTSTEDTLILLIIQLVRRRRTSTVSVAQVVQRTYKPTTILLSPI